MKFKVGDKVRVREDLEVGKHYGAYFNEDMAKLKGKVVEIEDVNRIFYSINEDEYYWTEEMFSGIAKEESRNLILLIAEMLGVEMGEEFEINEISNIACKFTDEYLLRRDKGEAQWYVAFVELSYLLSGEWHIKKLFNKPHLTEDEKVILRNLSKQYNWIARDYYGTLYIYKDKPNKYGKSWWVHGLKDFNLFQHLFQFVKCEDKEPYKIQELLEEYENLRRE